MTTDADTEPPAEPTEPCEATDVEHPRTVSEVQTTLRSTKTFPFPGGWKHCAGPQLCADPENPVLSFDAAFTTARCGQNYEDGFHASADYPRSIVERDVGHYEIEVALPAGTTRFGVAAIGPVAAPPGLRLLDAQQRFAYYRQLDHLP